MLVLMDAGTPETCGECGFNARAWRVRDAVSLLNALGEWWRLATDGVASGDLNARPAPAVWSVLEYGVHSALVTAMLREGVERIVAEDGVELPELPSGADIAGYEPVVLDRESVVADLEREGRALAVLARDADPDAWSHVGRLAEQPVRAEAALFHAVHDATHHHMDVGRGLVSIGAGTPAHTARVVQVNASDGGVPKRSVGGGRTNHRGLVGDRQASRNSHGRPYQALCLWSMEVIEELAAEGHPIEPGSAGENLTLSGVDWAALRPGARLRIGSALAEISFPVTPCVKQSGWFSDGDFVRISYERNPHWVRWYAWVREPGEVHTGDAVHVQPSERPRS